MISMQDNLRIIFGAAGFAKETLLVFRRRYPDDKINYFVSTDADPLVGDLLIGVPVISETEFFSLAGGPHLEIFIAIGSPKIRKQLYEKITEWDPSVRFPALIDPSVVMDSAVGALQISDGSIICAGSVLTTDIIIGRFSHINLNCTVGHDSEIGSFSTLSPGVHVSGNVTIGDGVFCGSGAVILEGLHLAPDSVIGAGAVLVSSTPGPGVYIGVPAKLRGDK